MDILNKDMKFQMLHDIDTSGMITIIDGAFQILSNDGLFSRHGKSLDARYKYSFWMGMVTPEHDVNWLINDWKIRNIKITRKMNHEV